MPNNYLHHKVEIAPKLLRKREGTAMDPNLAENQNVEPEIDFESLSPAERTKLMDAINSGAASVELSDIPVVTPTVKTPEDTAAVAPEATDPATPPARKELTAERPPKPTNFSEAMQAFNTAQQKLEARTKLINRLGTDTTFLAEYMHERGKNIVTSADPIGEARQMARDEQVIAEQQETINAQYRTATQIAVAQADTVLSGYDPGFSESLAEADAKWQAVHAALGGDQAKLDKYLQDPEFRKTVGVQGPSDIAGYTRVVTAVRQWMANPNTPLQKFLDFHDVARKNGAPQAAAPKAQPAPAVRSDANAEAERLAAKFEEPRGLPSSSSGMDQNPQAAIQDILDKAERIGHDNLSAEERQRVASFYSGR
jgi:hypothetical protein